MEGRFSWYIFFIYLPREWPDLYTSVFCEGYTHRGDNFYIIPPWKPLLVAGRHVLCIFFTYCFPFSFSGACLIFHYILFFPFGFFIIFFYFSFPSRRLLSFSSSTFVFCFFLFYSIILCLFSFLLSESHTSVLHSQLFTLIFLL